MREQPTGDQLLEVARNVLRDELIPALPADKRHTAHMIANAMAIATRQLQHGEAVEAEERASLENILAAQGDNLQPTLATDHNQLVELNRRLVRAIRQGRVDADEVRQTVSQHLLRVARHNVEESNPKYLIAKI